MSGAWPVGILFRPERTQPSASPNRGAGGKPGRTPPTAATVAVSTLPVDIQFFLIPVGEVTAAAATASAMFPAAAHVVLALLPSPHALAGGEVAAAAAAVLALERDVQHGPPPTATHKLKRCNLNSILIAVTSCKKVYCTVIYVKGGIKIT